MKQGPDKGQIQEVLKRRIELNKVQSVSLRYTTRTRCRPKVELKLLSEPGLTQAELETGPKLELEPDPQVEI